MASLRGALVACQLACETCSVACPAIVQPGTSDCSDTCRCCAHLCQAAQHCWNTPNQVPVLQAVSHSCRVCLEVCGACGCKACRKCAAASATVLQQLLIFFGNAGHRPAHRVSGLCQTPAS